MKNKDKITFFIDESFHSRLINSNTLNAENYFDYYIVASIGIKNFKIEDNKNKYIEFEHKMKKCFSIPEGQELKSEIVRKRQYQYGLKSFNKKSLQLYDNFFDMLISTEYIPFIMVANKLEYILLQIEYDSNKFLYNQKAFIYTIVKAINVYKPQEVIQKILNKDNSVINELIHFFDNKVKQNIHNKIKSNENIAFENVLKILKSIDVDYICFNWNYDMIFWGIELLRNELKVDFNNVKIIIDKEGKKSNTYEAALNSGIKKVYQKDSKSVTELRCADMLAGFISRMMRAIYEDTDVKRVKNYDKLVILSEEWFDVTEEVFNLYKKIATFIKNKMNHEYSTYISLYFDIFLEFISLIYYFELYPSYTKFKMFSLSEHRNKFNSFTINRLQENYFRLGL